ncbi:hypothetical protein [Mycobacteroides abscessus]|uniref:hypothetical protein n=1 Tax=Mycobacteroides abscessus TaxID=36809 RepID=UPI001784DC66|nr:hypothetical protein [Mycobacteroides abscessus]MBE5459420.1 hypothetical protein [Mycobacteroides abscessus]QOF44133.1 hypothetical protein E3G69_003182 [Mycobacteroides abscessus]QOF48832.1 hypothetical protein E3G70_003181 [Mycobacteroides abscessus]
MSIDVAEAGEANRSWYRQQTESQRAENPQLAQLVSLLEAAVPSSNVRADKVIEFAKADAVIDALSICIQQCGGDPVAGRAKHERQQGRWLVKRVAFEGLWTDGNSFIYGAANPEGLGVSDYGPFCLVISTSRVLGPNCGVFPGNTLDRYGTDTGIDSDLAIRQAGRWDFAPDVAIFAFGDTVLQEPDQSMWPTLICTDPSVLEIVTAGPIEFTDVLEVRISRSDRRRFNKLSVLDREGQLTDEAEREVVAAWQIVQEWINESHPEILLRIV